jgi:hypothetical protein
MTALITKALAPYRALPPREPPKIDMELMRQQFLELGWVLIPIEPTPADIHALAREMPQHGTERIHVRKVYDALVRERSK